MDAIRTLLLARAHTVVLDPESVASAATRPSRADDVERFEDELAQLGYVMSLDLGMAMRRLPREPIQELRAWVLDTLAKDLGAHRPHVPLFRGFPAATPQNTYTLYLRRVLSWLHTRPEQPCPWCGQVKTVGALDPCGHLVCRACWDGGTYAGCPICHRRVAPGEPFIKPSEPGERVTEHDGALTLLHLGLDPIGLARARFERLLARSTPLSPADRAEVELVIDTIGPRAVHWLPKRIAVRETMAIALARLWIVAPDRAAMVAATEPHVRTATDVARIAAVLMGGNAGLVEPMRLRSVSRGLRRAVLGALDRLPAEQVVEDVRRHARLWQRLGERLHPFEHAARLPTATLAFAIVRDTDVAAATFGGVIRAHAETVASVRIADDRVRVTPWAGAVEDRLRDGDARAAVQRLVERPGELLRRVDHLVRVTEAKQPDALAEVLAAIGGAVPRGAPAQLLLLASHLARRTLAWPRRVMFPKGEVLRAWSMPDLRAPLRSDAIGAICAAIRSELVNRAAARRNFARAVIDRGLVDLPLPINERTAAKAKLAWPRGSEIALPADETLRLFLHWEEPPGTRVDLDLSVVFYDHAWRHVATCDYTNLVVGERDAVHSGDLTSAPPPLGASEFVDLDLRRLAARGAQHAVVAVFSYNAVPFDRLAHGFAGIMIAPRGDQPFDPRAVAQRFDLRGRSKITVPLTVDLEARRLRWLDVHVADRGALNAAGGYRGALAHIGHDFADYVATHTRPTLWDVACVHAAARANIVYVRDGSGIAIYRRRDKEASVARLARLLACSDSDGTLAALPVANAPTWFALLREDLVLPTGSTGYVLDTRSTAGDRLSASDLVAELAGR